MEVWGGSQLTSSGVELAGLDVWVYSKPYGQSQHGGDVYYVSSCASGRISRLLLADVSGHGKSVASSAADLRTLMRRFVNRLDQKEFVRLLNEQFTAHSRQGSFSTAVVTTFFAPSRRLSLCDAGRPRPLLFRTIDGRWSLLGHQDNPEKKGPHNIPLGIFPLTDYEHLDIELDPGDCLVSYTDALIESCDADGEMLGEEGLLHASRYIGVTAGACSKLPGRRFSRRLTRAWYNSCDSLSLSNECCDAAPRMAARASLVLLDYRRGPRPLEWLVGLLSSLRGLVRSHHCRHLGLGPDPQQLLPESNTQFFILSNDITFTFQKTTTATSPNSSSAPDRKLQATRIP
jgi:hypothetical protein